MKNLCKSINQSQRRVLHRVPVQLRQDKKHIYEPVVVPLGQYHHREHPQAHLVEPLKNELKYIVCNHNEYPLVGNIYTRIGEIYNFYGEANGYNGWDLAKMMLHDACFLICYMQEGEAHTLIRQRLGMTWVLFMNRIVLMLENQIPLWLISLIHADHQSLLREFLIPNGSTLILTRNNLEAATIHPFNNKRNSISPVQKTTEGTVEAIQAA